MRNDSARWDAPCAETGFSREGLSLRRIWPERQVLVSGPDVLTRVGLPLIGWPDMASGPVALCLRRDRVLELDGAERAEGWQNGLAVTDVTDGYAVFEITGEGAWAALREGTEIRLDVPSRSVARRFHGLDALIYRIEGGFRLHTPRAMAEALHRHLRG